MRGRQIFILVVVKGCNAHAHIVGVVVELRAVDVLPVPTQRSAVPGQPGGEAPLSRSHAVAHVLQL
jgi:hypothetical protein